ncbi:MAG: alpha/beta fold hydrolase [Chloroflexota bacterium]
MLQLASHRIAYRESTGTGSPGFLFVHGNSSSSRSFECLLASELGQSHRMVAIDLPGHGNSDPAADPARTYNMPGYARMLLEAADALGMKDAIFVGWSLGGHIVLETAPHLPDAKGFVIFGTPPIAFPPAMEAAFLPNPNVNSGFAQELTEEQMRAYVEAFFKPGMPDVPETFMEDIRKTHGLARSIMGASIGPDGYADEVEIVGKLKQPLMVIHGAQEQLINGDYFDSIKMPTLWGDAVQIIADAGHAPHWETPDKFEELLADFAADL